MYAHPALPRALASDSLDAAGLAAIVADLGRRPSLWRPLARHDPAARWYERLLLSDDLEIWLIGWTPGQGTPIHDHAGAWGAFAVVEGVLTEEVYEPAATSMRAVHERGPGTSLGLGVEYVHRVTNRGVVNATSIHAYSPPELPMRIWEPVEVAA